MVLNIQTWCDATLLPFQGTLAAVIYPYEAKRQPITIDPSTKEANHANQSASQEIMINIIST